MKNKHITSCPTEEELTSVFLDAEGNEGARAAIRLHGEQCASCSAIIAEFMRVRETLRDTRALSTVSVSREFTREVMDEITSTGFAGILDDILSLSKRAVAVLGVLALIMLGIMMFPEDATFTDFIFDEVLIINGIETEVLDREDITRDDVIALTSYRPR